MFCDSCNIPNVSTILYDAESLLILHTHSREPMRNPNRQTTFRFKQFEVSNCRSAMKVGTDGVLLGAWAFQSTTPHSATGTLRILDVGCGTGVISLMMAQRFPGASVIGIDIDPEAAAEASENFNTSPWKERLCAVCADFIEWSSNTNLQFDLIISNPPFFANGALAPVEERRMARHEGKLCVESIIASARCLLKPHGRLALILPAEHRQRVEFQARLHAAQIDRLCHVRTVERKDPRRILVEISAGCDKPVDLEETLTIQNPDGNPSDCYRQLVEPFYIRIQ